MELNCLGKANSQDGVNNQNDYSKKLKYSKSVNEQNNLTKESEKSAIKIENKKSLKSTPVAESSNAIGELVSSLSTPRETLKNQNLVKSYLSNRAFCEKPINRQDKVEKVNYDDFEFTDENISTELCRKPVR